MKITERRLRSIIRSVIKENRLNEMDRMEMYQDFRRQEELHYLNEPLAKAYKEGNLEKFITRALVKGGLALRRASFISGLIMPIGLLMLKTEAGSALVTVSVGVFLTSIAASDIVMSILRNYGIKDIDVPNEEVFLNSGKIVKVDRFLENYEEEVKKAIEKNA